MTDNEHEIADALVALLTNDETWRTQAARQQAFARDSFSRERSVEALGKVIETARQNARRRCDAASQPMMSAAG